MIAVNRNTTAVTASENHFMASVCSRGKNAKASAPAAGKKTTRLNSMT